MKSDYSAVYEPLLDSGYVPDFITRQGVRHLLSRRVKQTEFGSVEVNNQVKMEYINNLKAQKTIAVHTKEANEQHCSLTLHSFDRRITNRILSILFRRSYEIFFMSF